jgi:hypothetical protein
MRGNFMINLVIALLFGVTLAETPHYIMPCSKSDPNINECLKNFFNHLNKYLAYGIPEINLPSVEPLRVNQVILEDNTAGFRVKAYLKDILAYGGSKMHVTDVKSDIKKLHMDLKLEVPSVKMRGNYDIGGQFLIIPFRVRGEFLSEFTNVTAIAKIFGKEVYRNNEVYMGVDRFDIDFVLKGARFKIIDKVAPRFAEVFNIFLNQNYQLIMQEMRRSVSHSLVKIFKDILQAAYASVPIRVYLYD